MAALSQCCMSFLFMAFDFKIGLIQNDNFIVVVVTVANLNGRVGGVGRSKVRLSRRHAHFSPHNKTVGSEGTVGAPLLSSSPTDKAVVPAGTCKGWLVVIVVFIGILEESKGAGRTKTAEVWRWRSGKVERGWAEAVEGRRHLRSCAGSGPCRACRSRGRRRRSCCPRG